MRSFSLVIIAASAVSACEPPPPAPEGLDESTSYMIREFYRDDAFFQAGVQGFMNWYNEEGYTLVGQNATVDNADAYSISDLVPDDIAQFPLQSLEAGRHAQCAKGVVSLAEMDCTWQRSEGYLARTDQHVVFPDNFEGYERTYQTPRATYEDATESGEFDAITEDISEPFSAEFTGEGMDASVMFTVNTVDPAQVLTANLPPYEMYLHFRHGIWDIDGEQLHAFIILTFITGETYDTAGTSGIRQSYSVEINVERPDDKTLRMFALWAEPVAPGFETCVPEDPYWEPNGAMLTYAVNTSLSASERLSDVCAGVEEVPAEP